MTAKKAVVIGAGIGGMATAARLAQAGFAVTVLEKNDDAGGRCGREIVDGYRFDTGPTIFLMPQLYERGFSFLGERLEDWITLRRIDPTYHLDFRDGTRLRLTSDMTEMRRQLEAIEPGSFSRMLAYLREGGIHHDLSVPLMVDRDFPHFWDFFTPANLLLFARFKAYLRHSTYANGFFRDARLRTAFTFQDLYMGLSPDHSPATYSLMQYSELATGMWYPQGGMYTIVEALQEIARRAGVEFRFETPVEKIPVSSGRAAGAVTAGGEFHAADVVVAGADLGYVYEKLLPDGGIPGGLRRFEYGCSTVMFYWGMRRRIPELGTHNVFFSGDYLDNFRALKDGRTASDTPDFYVHVPTRIDPSMAPDGCDMLSIAIPVACLKDAAKADWPAMQTRLRSFVLKRLGESGLPGLEADIRTEFGFLPKDWSGRYNLPCGSTHGLSHKLTQMAYLRPRNRHPRYPNVYFAGASTHPGTGIPMVLVSARLAAERILREWGPGRRALE
jgi:phytoene desaturase